MSQYFCQQCQRLLDIKNFYKNKNNSIDNICKKCVAKNIDALNLNTFLWLLKEKDIPYIEDEWEALIQLSLYKFSYINSAFVFNKYLAKMKLKGWQQYTWSDTYSLNNKEVRR